MAEHKLNSQEVLTALLGIVAVGCMLFLLYFQWGALNQARDEMAAEQQSVQIAQTRLQSLLAIREQAPVWEARLAKAERMIPGAPDENQLVKDLQSAAGQANTRLLEVRFDEYAAQDGYTEIPVRIAFEGRYHGLLDLLENLRNGPRTIRIDEIKTGKGDGEPPRIRADITASAFYRS